MKTIRFYIIGMTLLLSIESYGQLTVQGYTNYSFSGFNVLVQDAAMTTDSVMTMNAVNLLETNLAEIVQFNISQEIMDSLKAVPIFVDWAKTTGAAQYHPNATWLGNNGYIVEKARCVEISNVTNFYNWTNQNQPYMVLHELAHAYHHRVLNFNNATITNAFNNALNNNLYTNIDYHSGGGNYSSGNTAYGLNNEREFFAELTEAYFGLNDYYPFDYADLQGYDAIGFNTMVTIWGDISVSTQSVNAELEQISIYPNPSNGFTTLDLGEDYHKTTSIEIFDLNGRSIDTPITTINEQFIPIQIDTTSGIYLIKIIQNDSQKVIRWIKK